MRMGLGLLEILKGIQIDISNVLLGQVGFSHIGRFVR